MSTFQKGCLRNGFRPSRRVTSRSLARHGHVDHRIHGSQNILGQMAFDVMAGAKIMHRRDLALTEIVSDLILEQASCLERAAGRRLQSRGDFALQHDMFFLDPRVGDGNRRQQRLGIGVIGRRENLIGGALLDDIWPRYITTTRSAM